MNEKRPPNGSTRIGPFAAAPSEPELLAPPSRGVGLPPVTGRGTYAGLSPESRDRLAALAVGFERGADVMAQEAKDIVALAQALTEWEKRRVEAFKMALVKACSMLSPAIAKSIRNDLEERIAKIGPRPPETIEEGMSRADEAMALKPRTPWPFPPNVLAVATNEMNEVVGSVIGGPLSAEEEKVRARMLAGEWEQSSIKTTEAEARSLSSFVDPIRNCTTCRHVLLISFAEPCASCRFDDGRNGSKWEAK